MDQYSKLVYKVNLKELLEAFEEGAKPRQLFVLQPNMCTLIYAKNPKKSNYTGFLYNIPAKTSFDYEKFLLKHALPGPGSNIHCILEPHGMEGEQADYWLTKKSNVGQIPNFDYEHKRVSNLPRPIGWSSSVIPNSKLEELKLHTLTSKVAKPIKR